MHEPPLGADGASAMSLGQAIAIASASEDEQVKRSLVLNAQTQRQWEDFAISNTAVKVNIPKELSDELLKYHWCWIHPLFIFVSSYYLWFLTCRIFPMLNHEQVYRPAFIRGYCPPHYLLALIIQRWNVDGEYKLSQCAGSPLLLRVPPEGHYFSLRSVFESLCSQAHVYHST